ncbi:hypothetical protein [Streptomyces sp. NPDC101237]|uniref:hypothetical protein n=1 Tax=Streptomyces sp. NPDC101237 TaxID=3366139 RepID=UPI0037F38CE5
MYLVHAHLKSRVPDAEPPSDLALLVRQHALPEEAVEHLVLHANAQPEPVIGVYVLARYLEEAERVAGAVVARALAAEPSLRHWELTVAQVPLLAQPVGDVWMD